jgi:hypothetical protein
MKTQHSRITQKYRPFVAEIARLFVAAGGNKSETERQARKIAGCESFKAEMLTKWQRNPEFEACLREAEDGAANVKRARPSVRGPERIAWLIEVEKKLKSRHEAAEADTEKDKALNALLKVGQDIRDEERHYEEMQQKAARRSFARFMKNAVAFIKLKHPESHPTVFPVLRDVLTNIERIQTGNFDE